MKAEVTVVVPTYRRPQLLDRCLAGLREQRAQPVETIVVQRPEDTVTAAYFGGDKGVTP